MTGDGYGVFPSCIILQVIICYPVGITLQLISIFGLSYISSVTFLLLLCKLTVIGQYILTVIKSMGYLMMEITLHIISLKDNHNDPESLLIFPTDAKTYFSLITLSKHLTYTK